MEKLNSDGSGGIAVVSEEEWKLKYDNMKAALPQYKKMKKELGDIEVCRGRGRERVQGKCVGRELQGGTTWVQRLASPQLTMKSVCS